MPPVAFAAKSDTQAAAPLDKEIDAKPDRHKSCLML